MSENKKDGSVKKPLITYSEEDNSICYQGITCPTCKGEGVLGDYCIVPCYQCSGVGKIYKGHRWVFLNI